MRTHDPVGSLNSSGAAVPEAGASAPLVLAQGFVFALETLGSHGGLLIEKENLAADEENGSSGDVISEND